MRLYAMAAAGCLSIVGLLIANEVHASIEPQTDIPAVSPSTMPSGPVSTSAISPTDQIRLAQVSQGSSAPLTPNASRSSSSSDSLQEIVVSAQKRGDENLMQVPVPLTVVNTEDLVQSDQVMLQDYFNQVPGLIVAPQYGGQTNISIRGINSGGNPTVGVLIDDVPFGSSTQQYVPELDPGDLARVEVLRGPQGTLYGSDSMGGLVRFVTIAPSMDVFSGHVSAGTDTVYHGDGYGFNVRGSVNIPISDTLAIRASGFRRQEAGYIDDILTNNRASNEVTASGERIAALWKPSATFSINLNWLSQTIDSAGLEAIPSLGDFLSNIVAEGSSSRIRIDNYSGVVKADFGGFHLISVTGYNSYRQFSDTDVSPVFGGLIGGIFGVAPYAVLTAPTQNDKFTEELRVTTSIGKRFDVQLGGYFTHENTSPAYSLIGVNPYTGVGTTPPNAFYDADQVFTLSEYAGFGDVTYHFSDQFDIQLGARVSHIDQVFDSYYNYGIFNTPNPTLVPKTEAHATPFTYLVTPRFFITPDLMVYARAASGYRPGGTNTFPGNPPTYAPDKTYTYEVGTKDIFLDNRLTVDLSIYYINWDSIQISQQASAASLPYTGNGGKAKSEGVELTVTAKPFSRTTLTAWAVYDNAELTSDFAQGAQYGVTGDRLPYSAKYSGSFSARQEFPEIYGVTPFAALDASYTGNRIGIFQPTPARQYYPGFAQINVQAGMNYEGWLVNAFVNNVADTRGLLNGGLGYAQNYNAFVLIQPRTVGINFTRKF
jgi:iron complex outermembrane recepter protein